MKALLAAIFSFLKEFLVFWNRREAERIAADTPDERAKHDKEKFEQAVADGDCNTINDAFNDLHKNRDKAGDTPVLPRDN